MYKQIKRVLLAHGLIFLTTSLEAQAKEIVLSPRDCQRAVGGRKVVLRLENGAMAWQISNPAFIFETENRLQAQIKPYPVPVHPFIELFPSLRMVLDSEGLVEIVLLSLLGSDSPFSKNGNDLQIGEPPIARPKELAMDARASGHVKGVRLVGFSNASFETINSGPNRSWINFEAETGAGTELRSFMAERHHAVTFFQALKYKFLVNFERYDLYESGFTRIQRSGDERLDLSRASQTNEVNQAQLISIDVNRSGQSTMLFLEGGELKLLSPRRRLSLYELYLFNEVMGRKLRINMSERGFEVELNQSNAVGTSGVLINGERFWSSAPDLVAYLLVMLEGI